MTKNQKIMAVCLLSIVMLVLVVIGAMAIKNMAGQKDIPPDKGSITKEKTAPAQGTEADESAAVKENGGEAGDGNIAADDETVPAEEEVDEAAGWQTYSNDFFKIDYPANYKITGENKAAGELNFEINGFGAEAVIFVAAGKKALAFQGAWAVISEDEATDQKLLDTEDIDMNGIRFAKKYWAIRQIDNGAWLTAIAYYGCSQDGNCFSLLRGVTAKGITAWDEQSGSQLADKTKIKTVLSIMKSSSEKDTVNFNNMFLTFRFAEKVAANTAGAVSGETKWREYVFEPRLNSDSSDRKLIGVQDDGTEDTIAESVKAVMDWTGLPGFYPNKALFPPYAKEIYFTKYLSDSGSSSGMFALDVTTLKYRRLANAGKIYEDYNNYASIISPDKKLIASLGSSDLYILDLAVDKATVIATANEGEILNPAGPGTEYKWLDNSTVQYPVYKSGDLNKAVEVRKAAIK